MKRKIDDPIEMGKRLRDVRGIRTKKGVSRELGIPYSTLCSYESGTRCPPPAVRIRIADYYGVSVESLFCTHR